MVDHKTLFYPLFEYLRRCGVPLGVSEYLLLVETLRAGRGLENLDRLKRFCRLVWAKSREDQEIFDEAFAEYVEPFLRPAAPSAEGEMRSKDQKPDQAGRLASDERTPDSGAVSGIISYEETGRRPFQVAPLSRSAKMPGYQVAEKRTFHLIPRLPVRRREMAGAWRHLRLLRRAGAPEELDVEGTIQAICRTGFFLGPAMQPRRRNQAALLALIDCQGSMAPFAPFVEMLLESIVRGGMLGRVSCYYFHDAPQEMLYARPNLTGAQPLQNVLAAQAKENSVLIVSDGGAARGNFDGQRLEDTRSFLTALTACTYLYAWLNPVPPGRWRGTTAEDIAALIPMFSLDRDGLNDAVNILRGHPFAPGIGLTL